MTMQWARFRSPRVRATSYAKGPFIAFKELVDAGALAGREVSAQYLVGPNGWTERQGNVLAGIPVVLLSGDRFMVEGETPMCGQTTAW